VPEKKNKNGFDEQTLARVLEAAYVLQEHQQELEELKSSLDLKRKNSNAENATASLTPTLTQSLPDCLPDSPIHSVPDSPIQSLPSPRLPLRPSFRLLLPCQRVRLFPTLGMLRRTTRRFSRRSWKPRARLKFASWVSTTQ
jgi:hypothetical protein